MPRHLRLLLALAAAVIVSAAGITLRGQGTGTVPVADQFNALHFRSIGPSIMSGRITDFAVYEANPAIFYVGTAHGGVWKTTDGGATYDPEFQNDGLMSVGDLAVSQKTPDLVWLGSGEGNNRQSISWGDGIFKSTDGGKTWKNMGLATSNHINRIVMDPSDDNVVFVAAQGPLFASGGERGVYKTTDGGATWKQVLKIDADTGANDLVMDPTNNKTLYASTYERRRSQCCFNGGGPGSGIWKSIDAGETWTRLTTGLPGPNLGRIGLDIYRKSPNILYASIEAESPAGGGRGGGGTNAGTDGGLFRSDDAGASWHRVNAENARPMYFSQVRVDPNDPNVVYMGGVGLHMTIDGGAEMENDAAQMIHDDVHAIWIDPHNSNHLMIGDDGGVAISWDRSQHWIFQHNIPVGLFYHIDYDMDEPYHVCGGMQDNYVWCGPSASRTRQGIKELEWTQVQGGDGFVALLDKRDSQIVYSETQDGSIMRHNRVTGESKSVRPTPMNVVNADEKDGSYRFNWDTPMVFSPTDPGVLYACAQFVFRSTDRGDSWTRVSPDLTTNPDRGAEMIMGVKDSDVRISPNDGISAWPTIVAFDESAKMPGVMYAGTDDGQVQVTKDGGKTWTNVTDHLTGLPKGGWISAVVPSRYDAGTAYVTSDSHRIGDFATHIWVTHDFGQTFSSLNGNLSTEVIKTLTEDPRNADVLYVGAETGIFVTLDRGKSWQRLQANLPDVRVDQIVIHPRDNAMLVATHGRALWIMDSVSPIQEYAQSQTADAKLFSPSPALEWKDDNDTNMEFWGHQFFIGENPPKEAVIQFSLKAASSDVKLRVSDAAGKTVRELTVPANDAKAGIDSACWDLHVEPLPSQGGGAGFGRGGAGAGRGGRGGAPGGAAEPGAGRAASNSDFIPGVPAPMPAAGYEPENPCGGGGRGGGGGGGGFGRGGGGGQGPYVLPGTYTVALVVGGKVADSKPIKVVLDPTVQMSDVQLRRYYDVLMDLHQMQQRGQDAAQAMEPFYTQMDEIATKLPDMKNVPASVKAQFDAVKKDFDAVRVKFGVPSQAAGGRGRFGGGGGGGGGGRGGFNPEARENIVGRAGTLKGEIMSFWELPSATEMSDYAEIKAGLPKAIAEINAVYTKATPLASALAKYDVTLKVPVPAK